jgi:iron complex transport system substrate-binding protein
MFCARLWPTAVLPLAVVLCGCGTTSVQATAERPFIDARGATITVPAQASRVVALSEPTLDAALALGLTPIATTAGRGQRTLPAYLRQRAHGIANVGALGSPNLERIARLQPDLMLIDGTAFQDDAVIDKLRRIAPTAYVGAAGQPWQTSLQRTAAATGRTDRAAAVIAAYHAEVRRVRATLGPNADATVSVVRWSGIGLPAMILRELLAGRVLDDLHLKRPASQRAKGPGHSVPVSLEALDQLDADWIFLGALGAGGGEAGPLEVPADADAAQAALQAARDTPGWDALGAVRARHVVAVDGSAWTSAGGPLAAHQILRDVAQALGR